MSLAKSKQSGSLIRVILLFVLLLGLTCLAKAERLPIKIYTTADGLARDHVSRIRQDSRGFLWFCTSEGLSRFDGYRFTNYGREQGLLAREINDFLETRSGVYWIATSAGLYRFNPNPPRQTGNGQPDVSQKFIAHYPGDAPSQRYINVLYEDRAGTVWCGTSAGLYRLEEINGQWTFSFVDIVKPVEKIDDSLLIQAILEDRQGALWISTKPRLYRRRPDGVSETYAAKQGLPVPNLTAAMIEDRDGRIWIGTREGLYQLVSDPDPSRSVVAQVYATKEGLAKHRITSLLQSSDGKFWVGAENGISRFLAGDKGDASIQDYSSENGLSDMVINALTEDRDGNLWLGSEAGGAMKLAVNGFTTYGKADGLGNTRVAAIFESRTGELCVTGNNEFISKSNGRTFTAVIPALPKRNTYRGWGWYQLTFQDHTGEWWMPTGEGLVRYPKLNRLEQLAYTLPKAIYTTRDGLPTNEVFRLFEDSHGDIWISTLGRPEAVLTRWQRSTETFHTYLPSDNISDSAPTGFCETSSGDLWIGFYNGGVARYRGGRFSFFTQADGLPAGLIRGLYADHAGRLWIASANGGVARLDNPADEHPRFVIYTTTDGLSSNQATCITEDQWGKIYIGTGRGVNQLDPVSGHIKQFTAADGLANNFINVSFRSRDGALWFGTLQGLSRLVPQPEQPRLPPPAFISALRTAGETYPISDLGAAEVLVPELEAGENQIQIDFVGFGLMVGESLRYQYKLEGSNVDWSPPLEQRSVNYGNLAPGAYRFLVRAVSADGRFSEFPASVTFKILPPIWRRWWFLTLTVLLVAYAVFAFDRYRVARLKELNAALTESQKLTEQLTQQGTELRKANRSLELEAAVTSIISEAATLTDAAPKILQAICEVSNWQAGELWEVDTQTRSMRCVAVWQPALTSVTSEAHSLNAPVKATTELAQHNGTEGESPQRADINGEKTFSPAPSGNGASPRNAFGFPILLGQEVLGILKLFSHAEQQQDKELFEMMSTIGSHIGQLIDRKRGEEALKKSREERLAELQRVRKRIARDLHDDIGSSLTQITILSEVAHQHVARDEKQGLEPLTRIISVSNELVDAMSDIVWAINPQKDHLSDLLQRMRRFASDIFTARNITFRFQTPGSDKNIELGANLRREIFLVFKETVNNVVKHSDCSRAEIEFHIDSDWLVLMIKDNGKGFDVASVGDANADRAMQGRGGNGINSMWKRAAEMGGEYKIVSGKGDGTTSTLRVPVNR